MSRRFALLFALAAAASPLQASGHVARWGWETLQCPNQQIIHAKFPEDARIVSIMGDIGVAPLAGTTIMDSIPQVLVRFIRGYDGAEINDPAVPKAVPFVSASDNAGFVSKLDGDLGAAIVKVLGNTAENYHVDLHYTNPVVLPRGWLSIIYTNPNCLDVEGQLTIEWLSP